MLVILFVWIYIFLSSFSVGLFTQRLLQKVTGGASAFSAALTSVLGLISITVVLSYCSLFLPINNWILHSILALITASSIWYFRDAFLKVIRDLATSFADADIIHKLLLVVFFLFILIKASGQVQSLDSGSYHLPFIKWVEAHHLITGLANVHSRFGFNYHYHILYAFYGFACVFGTTIHALNGYLFLMGFVYLYGMYTKNAANPLYKLAAIIALLYISQINKGMTGFSPDFPVAIVQMMIVFECLKYLDLKYNNGITQHNEQHVLLTIFLLTFGAISLKLATVSVVFVVTIVFFRSIFNLKTFATLFVFGVVILSPYLFRNYTMSGYLVYPFYSVDLFHVPWKVPMARTIDEKIVIKNFALGYPYYYKGAYHYNAELFKTWIKNLAYLNKAYPPIIAVIAFCIVVAFVKWTMALISRTKENNLLAPVNVILYGLVAGIFFWFYNAPDPRFGNGIILPLIAIVLADLLISLKLLRLIKPIAIVCCLAIVVSSAASLSGFAVSQTVYQTNKVNFTFVMQEPYPAPDTASISVQGYHSYQAKERCWECPLPCSYTIDSFRYTEPGNVNKGFLPMHENQ